MQPDRISGVDRNVTSLPDVLRWARLIIAIILGQYASLGCSSKRLNNVKDR